MRSKANETARQASLLLTMKEPDSELSSYGHSYNVISGPDTESSDTQFTYCSTWMRSGRRQAEAEAGKKSSRKEGKDRKIGMRSNMTSRLRVLPK